MRNGKHESNAPSRFLKELAPQYVDNPLRREEMVAIYGEAEVAHALASGIVHFNGEKPWKGICTNMDIWWDCYRRSLFFDEAFCRSFWDAQHHRLERLSLMKRIKLLLRYPVDRKHA